MNELSRNNESHDGGALRDAGAAAGLAGVHPGQGAGDGARMPGTVVRPAIKGGHRDAKAIERIKGRCRIDEVTQCWIWTGATYKNLTGQHYPKVWGFDAVSGEKKSLPGKRAVWFAMGNTVPPGWRVYSTCGEALCVNPAHIACGPGAEFGALIASTGKLKGQAKRILANRKIGRGRSKLTTEIIAAIHADGRSGKDVSRDLGISDELVSKVRRGGAKAWQPVGALGGMFSGLLGAAS